MVVLEQPVRAADIVKAILAEVAHAGCLRNRVTLHAQCRISALVWILSAGSRCVTELVLLRGVVLPALGILGSRLLLILLED